MQYVERKHKFPNGRLLDVIIDTGSDLCVMNKHQAGVIKAKITPSSKGLNILSATQQPLNHLGRAMVTISHEGKEWESRSRW
jgi:hypothetical protein